MEKCGKKRPLDTFGYVYMFLVMCLYVISERPVGIKHLQNINKHLVRQIWEGMELGVNFVYAFAKLKQVWQILP